jgi:cbb3-type cytochrome oxidase subunit 1
MAQDYHPITSSVDTVLHLKEPSLGTYKALKMISLRYVVTSLITKKKIMAEFCLPDDFLIEELGVEEYYHELLKALFMEGKMFKDVDPMDINIMEVNRAYRDFFEMLNGN